MTYAAPDMVNSPPHYQQHPSGREVIEVTEGLPPCLAAAAKYALRAPHKGTEQMDWGKCEWYLNRHLDWMARHPVRAFIGKMVTLVFGRSNDDVLEEVFAAERDDVVRAVIACCQTGFEMDVDHAIKMVEIRQESWGYPVEVLHA